MSLFLLGCSPGRGASPEGDPTASDAAGGTLILVGSGGAPAGTAGVGGTLTSPGSGGTAGETCNQDVDVVFVLDVSGSMIPPLTTLVKEVGLVDAALQTKNLPSPPHYGLVIFVDDVLMMNGGAPYADIGALTAAVSAEINTTNFLPTRQAGPGGVANFSWPENSLDALHTAATGFQWRPAATTLRTIILVTDASFWDLTAVSSAAGDPGGLEANTGNVTSAHSYDEVVTSLRDNSVWVNTFAALTGGPPGFPLSPPSHGLFRGTAVNVGIGFHEPYGGKPSIAGATGGLAWDIDAVYDGIISLATPVNDAIAQAQCVEYPPPEIR